MPKIVLRAIRTRSGYPNFDAIRREAEQTIDHTVKPELLDYFTRITALWKHKVDFRARKKVSDSEISIYVYPAGENKKLWTWTTKGTRRHPIVAKNVPLLRFRTEYKPKTAPGYRYRGPGKATGPWRAVKEVPEHPGTKPRNFEKHIKRFYTPKFRRHMENAMRRGARRI